jgi:hypothetical protein
MSSEPDLSATQRALPLRLCGTNPTRLAVHMLRRRWTRRAAEAASLVSHGHASISLRPVRIRARFRRFHADDRGHSLPSPGAPASLSLLPGRFKATIKNAVKDLVTPCPPLRGVETRTAGTAGRGRSALCGFCVALGGRARNPSRVDDHPGCVDARPGKEHSQYLLRNELPA